MANNNDNTHHYQIATTKSSYQHYPPINIMLPILKCAAIVITINTKSMIKIITIFSPQYLFHERDINEGMISLAIAHTWSTNKKSFN